MQNTEQVKIFYPKFAIFKVEPKPPKNFVTFIANLKKNYEYENTNIFFWNYCTESCEIIVEDSGQTANDIFNQFVALAIWLFSNNCTVNGFFYYRINNLIEYIFADGLTNNIQHNIIFDYLTENSCCDVDLVMEKTKFKLQSILKKSLVDSSLKTMHESKIIVTHNFNQTNNNVACVIVNPEIKKTEDLIVLNNVQNRLTKAENKIKKNVQLTKFLWNFCAFLSVVTTSSIICACLSYKKDQV